MQRLFGGEASVALGVLSPSSPRLCGYAFFYEWPCSLGCFDTSPFQVRNGTSPFLRQKGSARVKPWVCTIVACLLVMLFWLFFSIYTSAGARDRFKGNKTQLGSVACQRVCCPRTFGGWVACYTHPACPSFPSCTVCINSVREAYVCLMFSRPVLPGYTFVPCGFTRSFLAASVSYVRHHPACLSFPSCTVCKNSVRVEVFASSFTWV